MLSILLDYKADKPEIRKPHPRHHGQVPRTRERSPKTPRNSISPTRSPLRAQSIYFSGFKSPRPYVYRGREHQAHHLTCFLAEGASYESRDLDCYRPGHAWEVGSEVWNGRWWVGDKISKTSDCQVKVLVDGPHIALHMHSRIAWCCIHIHGRECISCRQFIVSSHHLGMKPSGLM